MARQRSTAVVAARRKVSSARRAKPQQQQQPPRDEGPPIIPPDVVLWAAEQSDYVGFNPWFVTTVVGMINVAETLFGFAALALLLFSPTLTLAHRTLLVTSSCMSYTSLVLLLGSMSAPFTDTYMPLTLYVVAGLAGYSHYFHAKRCYIRVFSQPEP
ncbi:hypothetical protein MTO96_016710 [Rhipicephalus appendiculatus]